MGNRVKRFCFLKRGRNNNMPVAVIKQRIKDEEINKNIENFNRERKKGNSRNKKFTIFKVKNSIHQINIRIGKAKLVR